jgi:hypothetical protein
MLINIGAVMVENIHPVCHQVYVNLQGSKDKKCPFYHVIGGHRRKGNLVQHICKVKFHFFFPTFDDVGQPSTNQMAIIYFSKYSHAPPPPIKISGLVKDNYRAMFNNLRVTEITAHKLLTPSSLSILLNGEITLSTNHLSLNNLDAVNHLI